MAPQLSLSTSPVGGISEKQQTKKKNKNKNTKCALRALCKNRSAAVAAAHICKKRDYDGDDGGGGGHDGNGNGDSTLYFCSYTMELIASFVFIQCEAIQFVRMQTDFCCCCGLFDCLFRIFFFFFVRMHSKNACKCVSANARASE